MMTSSSENISVLLALCAGKSPVIGDFPHVSHIFLFMYSLICAWLHGWVSHRDAGNLRCHRAHYDVTKMGGFTDSFLTVDRFYSVMIYYRIICVSLNKTLRLRRNGRHFADIFKCIFWNENVWIPIRISRKFVPKGPINNIPALVQIMAWRRPDAKPLSEPMMISLPTHICVTRPQCVKSVRGNSHWTSFQSFISRNVCFSFLQRPSVVIGHTKKDEIIINITIDMSGRNRSFYQGFISKFTSKTWHMKW